MPRSGWPVRARSSAHIILLPGRRRIFFENIAPVVVPIAIGMVDRSRLNMGMATRDETIQFHLFNLVLVFNDIIAPVVELVDTQDLKSCDPQRS